MKCNTKVNYESDYDYDYAYEHGHPKFTELESVPDENRDELWYRMADLNNQIQDLMESLAGQTLNDYAQEELLEMADRILDATTCELYTQFGIASWVA